MISKCLSDFCVLFKEKKKFQAVECVVDGEFAALRWKLRTWVVGNLLLQGSEGVLHVLQQLSVVSFNFSFAILHGILWNDTERSCPHCIYRV